MSYYQVTKHTHDKVMLAVFPKNSMFFREYVVPDRFEYLNFEAPFKKYGVKV